MSRFKGLIVEIHDRSLWQVLLVYAGGSWAVLEAVAFFRDEYGSPGWLLTAVLVLLVVGLFIVVLLSLVPVGGVAAPTPGGAAPPLEMQAGAGEAEAEAARRRVMTWRNAGLGFAGALAVWGLIAAGWVVMGGTGFLLTRAAAADLLKPEDCIVVAEFENETETPALGATVRDAVVSVLFQSERVSVLGDSRVRETLGLMRVPDTTYVDQRLALEIASRESCPIVVSGAAASLGTGYSLSASILETETGDEVVRLNQRAADETGVVGAVERLAWEVRRHLGESLPSIRRSEPLARFTTSSLEALRLYTLAVRRGERGDRAAAIPLLEQAVALDTAFAEAYRKLSAYGAGRRNLDVAYRFRDRLTFRERLLVVADHHREAGRLDSASYYYGVLLERYPSDGAARNNLCLTYNSMGRFEQGLEACRSALALDPRLSSAAVNLAVSARSLGRHALADSALAVYRELTGQPSLHIEVYNALYRGNFAAVDSLAGEIVRDPNPQRVYEGRRWRAALAAMYGRVAEAVEEVQAAGLRPGSVWFVELAYLAAGTPERALSLVDSLRSRSPLDLAEEEYFRLGVVAYGYALAGDTRSARAILAVMDSLAAGNDVPPNDIGEKTRALIALQEERAEDAVEHLRRATAARYGQLRWDGRRLLAEANAALGHLDQAIAQYDTVSSTYRMYTGDPWLYCALRPLAHERLGALYLEVGDTVSAARHVSEFIELWQDADPELRSRVESARRLRARLAAEGT